MIHLSVLVHVLDLMGEDTTWVDSELGLPSVATWQEQDWVDAALFDRLMCLIVERTGKPDMGLMAATSQAMLRYGISPMLLMHAPSFKQAVQDIIRYSELILESAELSTLVGKNQDMLLFEPMAWSPVGRKFRSELTVTGLLQVLRYMGAKDADILGVGFQHAKPNDARRYREMFGAIPVGFGVPVTHIHVSHRAWDFSPPFRDDAQYQALRAKAEVLLAQRPHQFDFEAKVRRLIQSRLEGPLLSVDVARALDLSERGLRRLLADAGLSFSAVLSQERVKQAKTLLLTGDMPIKAIALKVGFQSVNSFHRAFRESTGYTPLVWRERALKPSHSDGEPAGTSFGD